MSKKTLLYIFIGSLAVSTLIFVIGITAALENNRVKAETSSVSQAVVGFVLREYDGGLGLFRGSAQRPYRTIEYDLSYFGEYDRELLRDGIAVETEEELNILLEDMTS